MQNSRNAEIKQNLNKAIMPNMNGGLTNLQMSSERPGVGSNKKDKGKYNKTALNISKHFYLFSLSNLNTACNRFFIKFNE